MTDARRKTKIILLQQSMTLSQLAHDSGLAEATIHNVLDGRSASPKSRQAITNALQAQIWDDVPVTARYVTIPKGTQIVFEGAEVAQDAEWQLPVLPLGITGQ